MSTPTSSPVENSSKGLGLTLKIAAAFIGIGVVAVLVTALCAYFLYGGALQSEAEERLAAVRTLVQNRVEAYVGNLQSGASGMADAPIVRSYLDNLASAAQDPMGSIIPDAAPVKSLFEESTKRLGYEDLYLLSPGGVVLSTAKGEVPVGGKVEGEIKGLVGQAKGGQQVLRVLNTFGKSGTAAIVQALPVKGREGQIIGVLVAVSPFDSLTRILSLGGNASAAGLGETGRAYLVDGSLAVRTPAPGLPSKVETAAAKDALAGSAGTALYNGPAGVLVLGAYERVRIGDENWAVVVEQDKAEALAPVRQITLTVAGAGLVLIILIGVGGGIFARVITGPILALEETMRRVAAGDENARAEVRSGDEIGKLGDRLNAMVAERNAVKDRIATENKRLQSNIQDFLLVVADASEGKLSVRAKRTEGLLGNVADALNRMLENVGILIGEAKKASGQVEGAAGAIAVSAQELTGGAERQRGQLEVSTRDVGNLTSEAQRVAENSREAADAAARAKKAAEDGAAAVREIVDFMGKLSASVEANARKIARLGERSKEISGIVRSISDISSETDVLAMNASIEAARAGEQGRGFTIVADQVRALADRARLATIEIEKLAAGIQDETIEAVHQMEQQSREVQQGARQAETAGTALSNIVDASVDSSTLVEQISQSAREQEKRAEAVSQAVLEVNRISEEAHHRTLEFRQTSDQLAALAAELNKQLANFQVATGQEEAPGGV